MKLMTLVFVAMAVCVTSVHAAPGVPPMINLQGRVTDATGNNLRDGEYTITFRIYGDNFGGDALWEERLPVQVTGGLFSVVVGNINAIPADVFSDSPYRFLGVTVDPEPELPRIPFNSVAYAFQAQGAHIATVALDLICSGCVSVGEIATDAVGSDEIAAGAVGTSEVADGSLTVVNIFDEPGVASNTSSVYTAITGSPQTLSSRSINCPAAGYILAIATAAVGMNHTSGAGDYAIFGVSTTPGVFPSNQNVFVGIPSDVPSAIYRQAVTVHGLFSTTAGSNTLFFMGSNYGGNLFVNGIQFTLIYFPSAYGAVVSTAAPGSGAILSDQSVETDSNMIKPAGNMAQGVSANQLVSKQELELMRAELKAEMDSRIQQIEESIRQARSGVEEKR